MSSSDSTTMTSDGDCGPQTLRVTLESSPSLSGGLSCGMVMAGRVDVAATVPYP